MSTAGGPRLKGIGRSGDSDIVLCMDAHDAGSYPGEPTTNYIKHTADGIPVSWWGDGSNQSIGTKGAVDITDNNLKYNGYPTILWTPGSSYNGYLDGTADIDQTALSTVWTFSCYVKAQDGGTLKTSGNDLFMYFYRGAGSYPSDSGTGTVVDAGDGWYRLSLSVSGVSNYAGLMGFSNFRAGVKLYLSGAQLEKKSYPTPFVTGFTDSGEVYDGRPASTNLMIHGNVGHNYPNILSEALSKFETSTGWTVGQDWSINSGTKVAEITNWTQASFLQRAASPAEVTTGKRYTITADITATAGILYVRVGNSSYEAMSAGIGSSVEVTCGSTPTETVLFYSGGWTGTLDNVRVELSEWIDSSPSKHAITAYGTIKPSNTQSKFPGGSIYFDGSGDYLTIPASGDWDVGTGDWTLDCWAYTTTSTSYAYVFDTRSSSYTNNFALYRNGLSLDYYAQVTSKIYATSALTLNTWHHIALVRSGSTVTMYVDGVSVGSATDANDYQGLAPFTIGTRYSIEGYWQGYQDEFRFTKGTALWTSAFTPPTRRNSNGPVVDLSGHDNAGNFATKDMTDVSTYRDGQVIEPVASAVWDFDGTDDKMSIVTDPFDLKCFEVAIEQWKAVIGNPETDMSPNYSCIGFVVNNGASSPNDWKNGVNIGSWTGGATYETLSWWGYGTPIPTRATYIRDDISVGMHIYTFNWNGSSYDIWLDGVKRTTYAVSNHTGLFQDVIEITPGVSEGFNYWFRGKIGCLRCYDISLTDQQIKQNFNAQRSRFGL